MLTLPKFDISRIISKQNHCETFVAEFSIFLVTLSYNSTETCTCCDNRRRIVLGESPIRFFGLPLCFCGIMIQFAESTEEIVRFGFHWMLNLKTTVVL